MLILWFLRYIIKIINLNVIVSYIIKFLNLNIMVSYIIEILNLNIMVYYIINLSIMVSYKNYKFEYYSTFYLFNF